MKRVFCLVLGLVILFSLTGCGKDKGRILYNANLNKYVTLGDYKNIEVDTSSDKFKEAFDAIIEQDIEDNQLYVKKTKGKVENGETVNIDYVGKKDGVAFEGGTANGYDLVIGSGSFIEGFEDGLIGKKIGSTVNLNLTFPENYGKEELNGAKVVFTVKINYVMTSEKRKAKDYYKELSFKSLDEYNADVKQRAIKLFVYNKVIEDSKVKGYPKDDIEYLKNAAVTSYKSNLKSSYDATLEDYLSSIGKTQEEWEESIVEDEIKPAMKQNMPFYAIFDNEKLSVTKKEIDDEVDKMVKEYYNSQVDAEKVREYYGEYMFENKVVSEKVIDLIIKNAKIS